MLLSPPIDFVIVVVVIAVDDDVVIVWPGVPPSVFPRPKTRLSRE